MISGTRRTVLVLCGALALAVCPGAIAEPIRSTASRGDIDRWFRARADRIDFSRQQRWSFSFDAPDGRSLEALSLRLVAEGYSISTLGGGPVSRLIVVRTELHSPATIEERSRSLVELARRHGARFVGCDVTF